MGRLLTWSAGRRAKYAVIAAWLAVAAAGGWLAPRFEEAQQNDPVSFLPEDAESVRVLQAVQRLPGSELIPGIVVAFREGGLTPADRRAVQRLAASLRADPPAGAAGVSGPRSAPDGTAALLTVPVRSGGGDRALLRTVEQLRARVAPLDAREGLAVKVTGPAGVAKDILTVFGSINGTLLMATAGLVFVLLVLIYRSPIFWAVPLAAVGAAELASRGVGYGVTQLGVTVNGQSAGILLVLVFGAGTDYALLLVARYREELRRHADHHDAVRVAVARAGPTVVASGTTVIAGLLVLLLARVNGTAGLGPIGALGVVLAMASMLTLLPALLAVVGRRAFWPFVPRHGAGQGEDAIRGVWRRVGEAVARRPRPVWLAGGAGLAVLAAGVVSLQLGLTQGEQFRGQVESIRGQELLARAFPAGATAPTRVVVPPAEDLARAREVLRDAPAVASVGEQVRRGPPGAVFDVVLRADPYGDRALDAVEDLRARLDRAGLGRTLIGGPTAEERDYRAAAARDNLVIPPIVLVVVLAILCVLLRALLLPVLLVATVVLSYGAALGVAAVVFDVVFGFPGAEPALPLFAFIFLVALGVDYNIFLMARAREEAARHGTREGMLRGLAVTGAVITSAGIVLAGTFSTLAVLPLVALTEIGFTIAFGVLLDTFLVRSVLVPALVLDAGPRVWWPSTLALGRVRRRGGQAP